jgi:cbb3-type cytochrome oxidase subunit 1
MYLTGALIMSYNFYRTIKGDVAQGEVDKDGKPRAAMKNNMPVPAKAQTATS